MSDARRALGRRGEARAARYLRRRGLRIVARNWRCGLGEIDLVARDGDQLVVVEVRTQSGGGFAGGAAHTVGPQKQARLARLASAYVRATRHRGGARIDVIAIQRRGWWRWELRWYRDAVRVDEGGY